MFIRIIFIRNLIFTIRFNLYNICIMNTKLENLILLNQSAEKIHKQGKRVAVLLEGRDGAGKSGTIRDFTHYLPPYTYSVVPSFMPTKKQMSCWLKSWELLLPKKGQIVFYDRSHYSRALLQPIMGWCSLKQYENFMNKVIEWEKSQNVIFIKFWLSISKQEQDFRLNNREHNPLTYWKFSKNDKKSLSKNNVRPPNKTTAKQPNAANIGIFLKKYQDIINAIIVLITRTAVPAKIP